MKNLIVNAAAFVLCAGLMSAAGPVHGQSTTPRPPAATEQLPHRVGLIDMAQVFKNYKKFEALRDELKVDLQKSEEQFKRMAEQIRKEQTELKGFKEGSPEYAQTEKTLLSHTTQAETFRKTQQRDLIRREAQIYKTIYLEVADAVQKYAASRKYTLVLRFSRDEVDGSENPEDVMRGLNKQVVYYRQNDDMTNQIVQFLNGRYQQTARTDAEPAAPARN